jgi:nitrite reductase/ring-hydroxylating ferredoxin subunit
MAEAGVTRLTDSVKAYGANCAHADESMPTDRALTNAKNLILQQLFIIALTLSE